MLAISVEARQRLFNIICLIIGTIMFYRGITDFVMWDGDPIRKLLGLVFFGGVLGIYLMYRRLRIGFWLFVLLDFAVGFIFIFILEDVWHHHVWPHILFAAVFVPFYGDLRGMHVDLSEVANMAGRHPWIVKLIRRVDPLQRLVNRLIINGITSSTRQRPLPLSLWTPGPTPIGAPDPGTHGTFVSWPSLTERSFTGRHLEPMSEAEAAALPDDKSFGPLFRRGAMVECPRTTALFCFFAQWFTDSFLRSHPKDRRKNTSNHEIDLCQIYGLGQKVTRSLRTLAGDGKLRSRSLNGGEYPDLLADPETLQVKAHYANIAYDPIGATHFDLPDSPYGLAKDLRELLKENVDEWVQTDDRWRYYYAAGLERGGSTILYSALNTIFLREHNRLAELLKKHNSSWTDDQLFETARNINVAILLKIIIEDYINHLSGSPFKLSLEQGFADRCHWYRTNRISLEFNLLYRWHSMVPDNFSIDGRVLANQEFRFNNKLLEEYGVEKIIDEASRQPAGRLCLHNTPDFLLEADIRSLRFGRQFRLKPYNAYRESWSLEPYGSFEQLTDSKALAEELKELYPDVGGKKGIDRLELFVGLFAEARQGDAVLPPLLQRMVASDAFSQALTNPLLAAYVYGAQCFTEVGLTEIANTTSLADVVARNLALGKEGPLVAFTRPSP